MKKIIKVNCNHRYIGKLSHGGDLLEEITDFCRNEGIKFGYLQAIGAVSKARLAFYDQSEKTYCYFDVNEPLEITALSGNISLKEGNVMVHVHANLADKSGKVWGGHLAEGTIIFACEIVITVFDNSPLERGLDQETGLPLWMI